MACKPRKFCGTRTPTFMPYEPILLGVVFIAWWTFRPRKKIFSPPSPPKSPIRRRHHPSWRTPPWDFQKKTDPPLPGASDSPSPSPSRRKGYVIVASLGSDFHPQLGVPKVWEIGASVRQVLFRVKNEHRLQGLHFAHVNCFG